MCKKTFFIWFWSFMILLWLCQHSYATDSQDKTATEHKKEGIGFYLKKDFLRADSAFRNCIRYAELNQDWRSVGQCLNNLASTQFQRGYYAQGIISYEKATLIYQKNELDTLLGESYLNLGLAYKKRNIYDSAVSNFHKGIYILEGLSANKSLMRGYNMLANVIRETNSFSRAKDWYIKAMKLAEQENNTLEIASIYNNMGTLFRKFNDQDSAILCYHLSLSLKKETKQYKRIGNTHFNLGEVFLDIQAVDSALYYFLASIKYRQLANDQFGLAHSSISLTKAMIIDGNLIGAKNQIDTTEAIISNISSKDLTMKFLANQKDYFLANRKFKEAGILGRKIEDLRSEILNKDKQEIIASYEIKYDVKTLKETIVSKNEALFWISIIVVFMTIMGAFLVRERQKKKKAAETIETLFKDMHHRVKNNLSLLNGVITFRRRSITDERAKHILKDIGGQVDTINLIHQKLYLKEGEKVGNINLSEYLLELTENIFVSSGINEDKYELKLELQNMEVSADKANSIGLIVNEVITNTIKYGKKSQSGDWVVKMTLKHIEDQIELSIKDYGSGIDLTTQNKKTGGLGLIELLSKQIHATYKIWNEQGTNFIIKLKK